MKVGVAILCLGIFVVSCSKTDMAVREFSNKGSWAMSIMDDGTNTSFSLPKLMVDNCDDGVENFCYGNWVHHNGSSAQFRWRFGFSGSYFEFYPVEAETSDPSQAWIQCRNFSGKYDVLKGTRKVYEIESEESWGFPGKPVYLKME